MTTATALRCENCNGVAWWLSTAPIAKDKDGYTLSRTCRQCGAAGPDHFVAYAQRGGRNWASDPDKKKPPQVVVPAPVAPAAKKEKSPVAERTPAEQIREELDSLIEGVGRGAVQEASRAAARGTESTRREPANPALESQEALTGTSDELAVV